MIPGTSPWMILISVIAVSAVLWRFALACVTERQTPIMTYKMDCENDESDVHSDDVPQTNPVTKIDAVSILLEDMQLSAARRADAEKQLDAKATQLLSLVGGGAGVIAVVSAKSDSRIVLTPLLFAGLVCLTVVLLCCMRAIAPRTRDRGSMDPYTKPEFLNADGSDVALTYELVKREAFLTRLYARLSRIKAAYYFAGMAAFVVGIGLLVLNVVMLPVGGPNAPTPAAAPAFGTRP